MTALHSPPVALLDPLGNRQDLVRPPGLQHGAVLIDVVVVLPGRRQVLGVDVLQPEKHPRAPSAWQRRSPGDDSPSVRHPTAPGYANARTGRQHAGDLARARVYDYRH